MIKRVMIKPHDDPEADPCSNALWTVVGARLRQRRTDLELDIEQVAREVGISPVMYASYEAGTQIPASQLAEIAEIFDIPVVWFFQDVEGEEEEAPVRSESPPVYRVATTEFRVQALADAFRKLDLEGQQHLLAISKALVDEGCHAAAKTRARG